MPPAEFTPLTKTITIEITKSPDPGRIGKHQVAIGSTFTLGPGEEGFAGLLDEKRTTNVEHDESTVTFGTEVTDFENLRTKDVQMSRIGKMINGTWVRIHSPEHPLPRDRRGGPRTRRDT